MGEPVVGRTPSFSQDIQNVEYLTQRPQLPRACRRNVKESFKLEAKGPWIQFFKSVFTDKEEFS